MWGFYQPNSSWKLAGMVFFIRISLLYPSLILRQTSFFWYQKYTKMCKKPNQGWFWLFCGHGNNLRDFIPGSGSPLTWLIKSFYKFSLRIPIIYTCKQIKNKNTPLFTPQNYHRMIFLKYFGLILLAEACKVFSLKCSAGSFLVKYHAECAKLQRIYFKIEDVYIGDSKNPRCQFKAGTNRKRINFGQVSFSMFFQ